MKREAGAWCVIALQGRRCPRNGKRDSRTADATVLKAREGAVPDMADHRVSLASPETGLNDSWWLAVGEAEPRVWRSRLPVVPSLLTIGCQLIER